MFEHNAMNLIFYYIDLTTSKDVRLAFEALKVNIIIVYSNNSSPYLSKFYGNKFAYRS